MFIGNLQAPVVFSKDGIYTQRNDDIL